MNAVIRQAFLALTVFLSLPALAEDLKPMPKPAKMTVEQFAAQSTEVRRTLTEDPSVDVSFSLPSTYSERPFDQLKNQRIGNYLFGELVRFDGQPYGDVRPYFRITGQVVQREITPRLWLMSKLLADKKIIRNFAQIDDRTIEAQYVSFEDNVSMVIRAKAWLQGPRMMLAEFAVPVDGYDDLRDSQFYTLQSVKILHPISESIESQVNENFWNTLTLYRPASWLMTSKTKPDVNRIQIEMDNPDEYSNSQGHIGLTLISTANIEDKNDAGTYPVNLPNELNRIKNNLNTKQLVMDDRIARSTPKVGFNPALAVTEVYNVRPQFTEYETSRKRDVSNEMWVTVLRSSTKPERAIVVTLLTPARTIDLYKWAINTKAYEIILQSLALPETMQ